MRDEASALGVIGVFFTLLGAGLILDANCIGIGAIMTSAGLASLTIEARRPPRGERSP